MIILKYKKPNNKIERRMAPKFFHKVLSKIKSKNLDFIVLNSLNDKGAGFKSDTNKVSIIDKHNNIKNYELKSKQQVAKDIVKEIIALQEN